MRMLLVVVAGLGLAGCNAASQVDLTKSAYTSCLDQAVGQAPRARAARSAAMQRAFTSCKGAEQALVAASAAEFGPEVAAKAVSDGKAAYAQRLVAGR